MTALAILGAFVIGVVFGDLRARDWYRRQLDIGYEALGKRRKHEKQHAKAHASAEAAITSISGMVAAMNQAANPPMYTAATSSKPRLPVKRARP